MAAGLTLEQAQALQAPQPSGRSLDYRPWAGAETWRELAARMRRALLRIEASGAATAVIVGHGMSGMALVAEWLGIAPELPVAFSFEPASITELRVNAWNERQIVRLNLSV